MPIEMNPTLIRDIVAIKPDADKRIRPEATDAHLRQVVQQLKQSFAIYGAPYNEDTLKAALISHIWSTKATQEMFMSSHSPCAPHTDTTLGKSIHGGLVALSVLFRAAELYEE